jgi:hypothetical protein
MTALSTLFPAAGGGVSLQYASGRYYSDFPLFRLDGASSNISANELAIQPFVARGDVTVNEVGWWRANTTAANVYVGIYDKSGTLLTDCAVDAVTTQGLHAVNTTNVDLTGGEKYYFACNQSAGVICGAPLSQSGFVFEQEFAWDMLPITGLDVDSGYSLSGSQGTHELGSGMLSKSRTAAALTAIDVTDGSWTLERAYMSMGIIPA